MRHALFSQSKLVRWSLTAAALVAVASVSGCIEYNSECTPPIASPDLTIFHLAAPVPVARGVVRTRESALANAIADAYLGSFTSTWTGARPVAALENAGGIRDLGLCLTRTQLPKGPVLRRVLRDTIPFPNELVVAEVTEIELFDILEHGVATLARPGVTPAGQFLSVSGLSYEVDCARDAERFDNGSRNKGERVRAIVFPGRGRVERVDATTRTLAIALNDFLAGGGDNFVDLGNRAAAARLDGNEPWQSSGRFTYNIVEEHLRQLGPSADSPALLTVDPAKPRIVLENCN